MLATLSGLIPQNLAFPTGGMDLAFYVVALFILVTAVCTVAVKNILQSAVFLIFSFVGTAILYLLLHAEFTALAQVMVYVGGVVIFGQNIVSEEQLKALEADLLTNGCYSPIIVNEDMAIVDGHNRQRICEKHGLPYRMVVFSFEDTLEAQQWALDTQKGRRNLDKWELGKIALKLRPAIEVQARANQSAAGGDKTDAGSALDITT